MAGLKERDREYMRQAYEEFKNNNYSRPRDSQRSKLYNAEDKVRRMHDMCASENKMTLEEIKEWLENDVLNSRWWHSRIEPYTPETFNGKVKLGRGRKRAISKYNTYKGTTRLNLPEWSRNKIVVMHELAHSCLPRHVQSHGWLFAHLFLDLLKRFVGKEIWRDMRDAFDEYGVKWRRPRRISEERREILAERMRAFAKEMHKDKPKKEEEEEVDYVELTEMQRSIVHSRSEDFVESGVLDFENSRLTVTPDVIIDVSCIAYDRSCWGMNRYYLSLLGLLKKMKSHFPEEYQEALDDGEGKFRWLPYSVQHVD